MANTCRKFEFDHYFSHIKINITSVILQHHFTISVFAAKIAKKSPNAQDRKDLATDFQNTPATDDNFEHLAKIATIKYA